MKDLGFYLVLSRGMGVFLGYCNLLCIWDLEVTVGFYLLMGVRTYGEI